MSLLADMEARLAAYREALEWVLHAGERGPDPGAGDEIQLAPSIEEAHEHGRALLSASDPAQGILARLRAGQRHIAALKELVAAQDDLLVAYRLGSQTRGDRALTRLDKAKAALAAYDKEATL